MNSSNLQVPFSAVEYVAKFASLRFGRRFRPVPQYVPSEIVKIIKGILDDNSKINSYEGKNIIEKYNRLTSNDLISRYFSDAFEIPIESDVASLDLLAYPFYSQGQHFSDYSNDELINQFGKDVIYNLYEQNHIFGIDILHRVFLSIIALSLINDEIYVFETDFSHRRNIIPKYRFSPKGSRIERLDWTNDNIYSLFSVPNVENNIFGSVDKIEDLIKFQTENEVVYEKINSLFRSKNSRYYYLIKSNADYTCIYVIPELYPIRNNSWLNQNLEKIFSIIFNCLYNEARQIVNQNRFKGRLRHTISIQFEKLSYNYRQLGTYRHKIDECLSDDREIVNVLFSEIENSIYILDRDFNTQFSNTFDPFGNELTILETKGDSALVSIADIGRIIKNVISEVRSSYSDFSCILSISGALESKVLRPNDLRGALYEFLTNAAKYAEHDDRPEVRVRERGSLIEIKITNVGPALGELERHKIPRMSLRGINAAKKSDKGSGQGLASTFEALSSIGIHAQYKDSPLTPEQRDKFSAWRSRGYELSNHTITIKLSSKRL